MVKIGAMKSRLPINTAIIEMASVMKRAGTGSPRESIALKELRNGIIPSLEMAWRSLGAEVKDWRAAPMVEKRAPQTTSTGYGQAIRVTPSWPPAQAPNLSREKTFEKLAPKRTTDDKYTKDVVNWAAIVPMGMDFCPLARSPDLLLPARIPVHEGK